MTERPSNVLFVVLDTVRKDRLGPYGYDENTTPELSAFAEEATVFESAVAPAPWTLPVHASLFTGLYPSQHGADQGSPYLDDATTLAETLTAAGYDTACYSSNAWITPYTGLTDGFQSQDSFFEALPGDILSGPLAGLWQRINDNDRLRSLASTVVHLGAKVHARFASGDSADSKTPAVIDRTRSFIEDSDSDEGWFAFVNLMDAHLPYFPPEEFREEFAPGVDPDEVCQNSKEFNSGARHIDDEEWDDIRGLYDAEIAHMDAELGQLFGWLKETGQWDDTMVVVCADHGELHGEHDLYGHEFCVYDQLVNVPLLVKHPDLAAERRTDLVELLDLYHTVLDTLDAERAVADASDDPLSRSFDPTRSLLTEQYRAFAESTPGDPGQRAILADGDGDYGFVEYAKPVIELHHLEEKASEAGIDLPDDHRAYATYRAARGEAGKYISADLVTDEGFRVDEDPGEQSPVDPDEDDLVAGAKAALDAFTSETEGGLETADSDGLSDVDEETKDRLQELGYMQ
jgi:arylsulfatase A-like enzyme